MKPREPGTHGEARALLESLPLKQGLKREVAKAVNEGRLTFRVTSIKTRIETSYRSRTVHAADTFRVTSIKTRIETTTYAIQTLTFTLLESLPLKQGLKQYRVPRQYLNNQPFRVTSIKTRIETQDATRQRAYLIGLLESLPLKQGLKRAIIHF